jgi:Helix-turn-helix domain
VAQPRERESRDARRDDPARFLRELRALRDHAGLGFAELAARAHFPCDAIKAAESGPSLPTLPVLSAYVQGCGGTPAEWEERWRLVTGSPASPLLTARAAPCAEAADAGARVGAASAAAEVDDPDRVMAALNRVADGMAAASSSSSSSGASGSSGAAGSVFARAARSDAALASETAFDEAVFDEAVFEALATSPADPVVPAVPDQAPPADVVERDTAPARAQALDSVPPAPRPDYPEPKAATPPAVAASAVVPSAAAPTSAAAAAGQAESSRHPRLSRMALAALIAVGLLLIATLLVIVA